MTRALLAVVVVAALAVPIAVGARVLSYRGEANPGVRVLGVDVGGKDRSEVEEAVRAAADRWLARGVEIATPRKTVRVRRGDLVRLDLGPTVDAAMAAGSPLSLDETEEIAPRWRRADSGYLAAIAKLGRTPASARVELVGAKPVVHPARMGLRLDPAPLIAAVERGARTVRVPWVEVPPAIQDPAARSAAATANQYVRAPIRIDYHGARRGALTPAQLASAIAIRTRTHRFAVVLDPEQLARLVRPRLGRWIVRATNARFVVEGERVRVVPSAAGRDIDPRPGRGGRVARRPRRPRRAGRAGGA